MFKIMLGLDRVKINIQIVRDLGICHYEKCHLGLGPKSGKVLGLGSSVIRVRAYVGLGFRVRVDPGRWLGIYMNKGNLC